MSSVDLKVGITLQNVDDIVDQIVEKLGDIDMGANEDKANSDSDYKEVKEKMEEILEEIRDIDVDGGYSSDINHYYEMDTDEFMQRLDNRFNELENALLENRVQDFIQGGRGMLKNVRGSHRTKVMGDMDVAELALSTEQFVDEGGLEKLFNFIDTLPNDHAEKYQLKNLFSYATESYINMRNKVDFDKLPSSARTVKDAMKSMTLSAEEKEHLQVMQMITFADRDMEKLKLSDFTTMFNQASFREILRFNQTGTIVGMDHEAIVTMLMQALMKVEGDEDQFTGESRVKTLEGYKQIDTSSFRMVSKGSLDSVEKIREYIKAFGFALEVKEGDVSTNKDLTPKTFPFFQSIFDQVKIGATPEALDDFVKFMSENSDKFLQELTSNKMLLTEGTAGTMNEFQKGNVAQSTMSRLKDILDNSFGELGLDRNAISDAIKNMVMDVMNPEEINIIESIQNQGNERMIVGNISIAHFEEILQSAEFQEAFKSVLTERFMDDLAKGMMNIFKKQTRNNRGN